MAIQTIVYDVEVPPGKEISHISEVVPRSGEPVTELIINFVDEWPWPKWLVGWIAMDADGEWNWFTDEPVISDGKWLAPHSFNMSRISCRKLWPNMQMPSSMNRDWRMSKRGSQP